MSFLLALTLLVATATQRDAGQQVYSRVADSVLLVIVENAQGEVMTRGSAFVVAGGRLVTNAHVAKDGKIFVKGGAFKIACTVERIDEVLDIAILRPSAELSAHPLVLASKVPPSGSTVFALGNPQGLERTITQGLLTGTRTIDATTWLQVSAAISPGSSGGPVVSSSGEVIGVATSSLKGGQNLNFAVPAAAVRDLIEGRQAASAEARPAKTIPAVIALLEQSKYRYQKSKDGMWWITFEGEHLDSVDVLIQALDNMIVVAATVKEKPPLSADALRELMRASYDATFSKLALSSDGDVVGLSELPPDVTASSFKTTVEEVAALADDAAAFLNSVNERVTSEPPTSTEKLPSVPAGNGSTLSILRGAFELRYDPAKWKVKPSTEPGETEMVHASGDVYVKVISERIEMQRESFRTTVIDNARNISPDVALISETARIVNGLSVLVLRYVGTAGGMKFTMYNQMYSDASGTVQLAGYTGTNIFDEYQTEFLELFAGFRKVR